LSCKEAQAGSKTAIRSCEHKWLGTLAYGDALELQQALVEQRKSEAIPDTLLLLEHPPVITLGRAAHRSNVIAGDEHRGAIGVELFETGRGGDVTFHGPGQVVGYPIINLAPDRCDVRRYVRDLEETMIRAAAEFGVEAGRIAGLTGVWVGEEKLGAIGVRISRWVTMHGFAFNVRTQLEYFDLIVPCGIRDHGVTSLGKILGPASPAIEEAAASLAHHFGVVFGRRMTEAIAA
jgi:lipoyl(octanoyl) transferase